VNRLMKELKREKEHLTEMITYFEIIIAKAPRGNVRASKCGNSIQLYYIDECLENRNGKYVPKKDREKARKIVEREYLEKLRKVCISRRTEIEKVMQMLLATDPYNVFGSMAEAKQQVISKILLDDEEFAEKWQSKSYQGKSFPENYPEIYSERGERVRSKTEKIIADKLYKEGIPYRYEEPLFLEGFGVVYPDFKLLNVNTREEVLLEHFGRMDDAEYVEKSMRKLRLYEKNGYFLGKELLLTFETSQMPFDSRNFENMLKEMGFSGKTW